MAEKLDIPSNPIVPVRMSGSDKNAALIAARRDGYKSLGTWMKHLIRQRIEQQKTPD